MYNHVNMPLDFRLSAWPYGGDRYVTTYNTDRYLIDIRAVLDYVELQLRKTPLVFIFKTSFTLVNVYSEYTNTSVGLVEVPEPKVRRTGLVFTFTRTMDNGPRKANHIAWLRGYTALWGNTPTTASDFISISIPLNILTAARMQQMMDRDHRYLFDIAGGYTKAVIRSLKEFTGGVETTRKYLDYTIPKAMFYMAMEDWKYVQDFWNRMPDLLRVEWTPKFIEYYVRYIAPDLPMRQRSKYYEQYAEEAQEHIRQFILRYLQNSLHPDETNLVSLLPEDETLIHDVETLVMNLSKGIIT